MTQVPASDAAPVDQGQVNTEAVNDEPMVGAEEFTPTSDVDPADVAAPSGAPTADAVHPDTLLAAERLGDLQRLQAEYVNYKRRVDRDRALIQERAVHDVIEALLPVLDDIDGAREHGELAGGPFAAIADKLTATLGRFGAERFGAPGVAFDPLKHEALMHIAADLPEGTRATTVVQVLQPGYRVGERVIRPARVAVADPA